MTSDKLSNYLFLIVSIQVHLLQYNWVLCASLRHSEVDTTVENIESLSIDVCSDLQMYNNKTSFEECQANFIKSHANIADVPIKVEVKCQYQLKIVYTLGPSRALGSRQPNEDGWPLVLLTPQTRRLDYLPYDLVTGALDKPRTIELLKPDKYWSWSTVLFSDGSHTPWRRGPQLVPANLTGHVPTRRYQVEHGFYSRVNGRTTINAQFTWKSFDDDDVCFDFVNLCDRKMTQIQILPSGSLGINRGSASSLPPGTECSLRLIGKYGATLHRYRTPDCDSKDDCIDTMIAQNISITGEPADAGWDVFVTWSRQIQPLFYNVTLMAGNMSSSVQLPGHMTEAIFPDVDASGFYRIAIGSVFENTTAWTSEGAMFPVESVRWGAAGSALGGAWGLALCCALLAALALLWRRRRAVARRHAYFPEPEDKPCKEGWWSGSEEVAEGAEDEWEVRPERLLLHELVGEGAFGVVRRGTLAPADREVAVKMLKDFPTLDEIRSFRAEMEVMKSVGAHPHVVSLVGCCSGRRPFIVAEYCARGDLLTYLRCSWDVMVSKRNAKYYNNNIETTDYRNDLFKCKMQGEHSKLVVNKLYDLQGACDTDLTSRDLLSFCRQIAMGMEFLASNRLVHRDLAARNVLVSSDRTLKIADFGLSRDVYEENQYKQKGNGKMPMKWMALESLTKRIYTTQSDVWSFGVVMWEVWSVGGSPYAGVAAARLPRLLRAGYRMPRPLNCPPQLYEVMWSCWQAHPRARPTFAQLHARLDELLHSAAAHDYLALDLPPPAPPSPAAYVSMVIREKLGWSRGESYSRRVLTAQSNHYSSPPACPHKPQSVS